MSETPTRLYAVDQRWIDIIERRDARIAELEAALSDVRTILHNEALNQPVNSLSRWVGLYKRIDKLLSQPDREEI